MRKRKKNQGEGREIEMLLRNYKENRVLRRDWVMVFNVVEKLNQVGVEYMLI